MAFSRVSTEPFDLTDMVTDIMEEYEDVEFDVIKKAIRNGSLGKYGRTYKLCTQEVCLWIDAHLKEGVKMIF